MLKYKNDDIIKKLIVLIIGGCNNMATVISIASKKGGTGKSTTALALASILGLKEKKVLLLDFDPQSNVTYSSGIDKPTKTITDVLNGECLVDEAITKCKWYDLLCADKYLSNIEMSDVEPTLLKSTLQPVIKNYDLVLIDSPPSLGNLSYNSMVAANFIIVPVEASVFAMQGIIQLNNAIQNIREHHNRGLKILGILLVKYNERTIISRKIRNSLCNYAKIINTLVFDTSIRQGIAVVEAQYQQEPLIEYAKKSKPTIDYINFAEEVLRRIENA